MIFHQTGEQLLTYKKWYLEIKEKHQEQELDSLEILQTGEKEIFAEYLMNAQGEDVVAGIRTPQPISKLQEDMPEIYNQFIEIANKLETHHKDMQDMEFTIEEGKLYFLQNKKWQKNSSQRL